MSDERPSEELYDVKTDPFEINNLARDPEHSETLKKFADILNQWIVETDDKAQYGESEPGLKFMLGIWGEHCVNPEYGPIREKLPGFEGTLFYLKSESSRIVDSDFSGTPLFDINANNSVDIEINHSSE